MDQAPILPTAGPLLGDVHGCKVEHFKQAVVAGEHRFAFGNLPELAVESFDGISGINELPYLARMLGGVRTIFAVGYSNYLSLQLRNLLTVGNKAFINYAIFIFTSHFITFPLSKYKPI